MIPSVLTRVRTKSWYEQARRAFWLLPVAQEVFHIGHFNHHLCALFPAGEWSSCYRGQPTGVARQLPEEILIFRKNVVSQIGSIATLPAPVLYIPVIVTLIICPTAG